MQGVEVVRKPKRRTFAAEPIDVEAVRAKVASFAQQLPSQSAPEPDILPPARTDEPARELLTSEDFTEAIARLWTAANESFVAIGRMLNEAKEKLPRGEFMAMTAARLPFSHGVANKLMSVAKAIDEGVLPVERLPPSYSTVYEFLSLTPPEREQAEAEGLIRPDVPRQEVLDFKKRIRKSNADRIAELKAEKDRLWTRILKISDELKALGVDD